MQKAQKYMASAGKQLTNIGKSLTLGLTLPLVAVGAAAVKLGIEYEASMQQIQRTLGDSAKTLTDWAKNNALSFNMAESDAIKYGSVYSNLISSFEKDTSKNADLTQQLLQQSAVVASATGRSMEDVMDRIRSGLLGNTEAIEDLGIQVNVSMLEGTDAFKKFAGDKSWDQLDFQTQQQIRLMAILEQSTKKYGDEVNNNTASSMAQLVALMKDLGLILSETLVPVFNDILKNYLIPLATKFKELNPEVQKNIVKFLAIAAALGPVILILGKVITVISAVIAWVKGITVALAAFQAGTAGIGAILTAVFGPAGIVLLVIAAIAALVAGFIWLWNNCDAFRNFFIGMWNGIVAFLAPILSLIKGFIVDAWNYIQTTILPILTAIKEGIINAWNYVWETLQPVIENMKVMFSAAWEFIETATTLAFNSIKTFLSGVFIALRYMFGTFIDGIKIFWEAFGDDILSSFKGTWETLVGVFNGIVTIVTGIFKTLTALLTGNWSECWEGMVTIVDGVWETIKGIITIGVNAVIGLLNGFIAGANKIQIPEGVPGIGGVGINIPEIPYLAKGTDYFKGGLAVVGEEGPELVAMNRGSRVIPNNKTEQLLGGSKNMELKLFLDGRQFARALAQYNGEEQAIFNLRTGGAF